MGDTTFINHKACRQTDHTQGAPPPPTTTKTCRARNPAAEDYPERRTAPVFLRTSVPPGRRGCPSFPRSPIPPRCLSPSFLIPASRGVNDEYLQRWAGRLSSAPRLAADVQEFPQLPRSCDDERRCDGERRSSALTSLGRISNNLPDTAPLTTTTDCRCGDCRQPYRLEPYWNQSVLASETAVL